MNRPNVLIIHTDQQRYDSLGCTGNPGARTPNIDRLAENGILFTRHISSNTICMPSRASLLTGLYPPGHGVWDNGVPLNRAEFVPHTKLGERQPVIQPATIADIFAGAGYRTAMFGKLHLAPFHAPAELSSPESLAQWREHADEMNAWHGPYYGFQHVDLAIGHGPVIVGHHAAWIGERDPGVAERVAASAQKKRTAGIADHYHVDMPLELHPTMWLAHCVDRYLDQTDAEAPFLAFVGFPDPHHPFVPTTEAAAEFADSPAAGPHDEDGEDWQDYRNGGRGGAQPGQLAHLSREQKQAIIRDTNAMVWQIDCAVGRILASLDRRGLRENTIIAFTSDHGDFLGDHGLLRKGVGAAHQLLHVPCILSGPGIPCEVRNDLPMSNCDLLPTLAALAGVPLTQEIDGRDVFGNDDANPLPFAYCCNGVREEANFTVYDRHYRYTVYPGAGKRELFDHDADPWEARNLAHSPDSRLGEVIARMQEAIQAQLLRVSNPITGRVAPW